MFELEARRYDIEHDENWRAWIEKMPDLSFDASWKVRIIPPYGGALARFIVSKGDKMCDVYFDVYSRLGWMVNGNGEPIPYFELYPWEGDCKRYYINETAEMMRDIRTVLEEVNV